MTTTTKNDGPSAPAPESPSAHDSNILDRINDGLTENPRKLALWTLAICGAFTVGFFGFRYLQDSSSGEQNALFISLIEAGGTPTDAYFAGLEIDGTRTAEDRLAALADLEGEMKDTEYAAFYYWLVTGAALEAADGESEDVERKLSHYVACREACQTILSDYSETPWTKIPWRSSPDPDTPNPSLVQRRLDYSQTQIGFIEANKGGMPAAPTPDDPEKVYATLTLRDVNDPESEPRAIRISVYSTAAPIAVAQLKANADRGFWKGRHVFGLVERDENTSEIDAVMLGSALSKSPWAWDKHGGPEDTVGCTLPLEPSRLAPERGTVAFDLRRDNESVAGASPTDLVIHTTDDRRPAVGMERVIFGKIENEDDLDWLSELEYDKQKQLSLPRTAGLAYAPKKTVVIEDFTFQGTPQQTPDSMPDLGHWKEPEQPEKPKEEDSEDETKPGEEKQDK